MIQRKKREEKPDKKISELIPIRFYDSKQNAFALDDGSYTDVLLIRAKDWYHATTDDRMYDIAKWTKLYRTYPYDLKIVTMRFRCNTLIQQQHLTKRQECVKNELLKGELERKLQELCIIEEDNYEREFYLFFWGKDAYDLRKNRFTILETLGKDIVTTIIDAQGKKDVLFKMNNKNSRKI